MLLLRLVLGLAVVALAPTGAAADGIMLVQAGAFWMGRDDGAPEEAPLHRVFVRDFWIERHKVTNAEFAAFLDARGPRAAEGERRYDDDDADARIRLVCGAPGVGPLRGDAPGAACAGAATTGHWEVASGYADHPAVEVSWFGARDYCAWKGRRLPTEAEWEKAARGGDRRPYPWGGEAPEPERAVFGRGYNATEPTAGRPGGASPYRVEDLLGNLREWTSTALRPYPYREDDGREPFTGGKPAARGGGAEPAADAAGPAGGAAGRGRGEPERVVVRGASHDDAPGTLSVTRRWSYDRRAAAAGHHHVGFRCATSEDLGEIAR